MKKRNLFLKTAIASAMLAVAAGASAGIMTGTAIFATENFGPSSSTVAIATPPIVYTFNTPGGIVVNPAGVIQLYFRVAGGNFSTAPLAAAFATSSGLTIGTPVLSGDSSTIRIPLTNTTGLNIVVGVGNTVTYTGIAGAIAAVSTTLGTAGGAVTVQGSVSVTASSPNTGTALPADLDNGLSNVLSFATTGLATAGTIAASNTLAVAETARIDLLNSNPSSRFTTPGATLSNVNSANTVNLGSVTFTDTAARKLVDATTDYTFVGRSTASTLAGTVNGIFKTGSVMTLNTLNTCTALSVIAAGGTGVLNAGLTTFTFTGGTIPTSGVPYFACLTVSATTAAVPSTTPTASFTSTKTASTDLATTAAGALYALTTNGATRDVRSYIPASVVGYTSFVRVINTGNVAAAVTGQWLYENGTPSAAAVLIASHPVGGAVTLTSTQIEAALGAPAVIGNNRPRLRVTAPTTGMDVQSFFLTNSNGNFSDATGAQ